MKNNQFLDVVVGDRIIGFVEGAHSFKKHTLLITSMDKNELCITDTNPEGVVLYGQDLNYDSEELDSITMIGESTFVGIKDKKELEDKILKLSMNDTATIKVIDDNDEYEDGCLGVRVRIGDYSFYCFTDKDDNPFDDVGSLYKFLDDTYHLTEQGDAEPFIIADIASAIWDYESSGLSKAEAMYYEALIDEQIALLDKTIESDDVELD